MSLNISDSSLPLSIRFKIDFCSNLKWINQEDIFHHSKMFDEENNIWSPMRLFPFSDYIDKHFALKNDLSYEDIPFEDDGIGKIDYKTGKFLFRKSIYFQIITIN